MAFSRLSVTAVEVLAWKMSGTVEYNGTYSDLSLSEHSGVWWVSEWSAVATGEEL